ncbi:hypothetical protein LNAT_P1075 [Lebetimonas natsushimae]|uniref:Uncharacterized protein n=1 Tax=Lebetimonas natsushimae TaxID=1936991 RepID=A0A292YDP5_9BACT|nr:hypothetical protein [Lebetimonas natsushimae]GAX87778.1 hypothetical protein LNAT_P1075 [Lebetimonas natsushimae]
MRGFCRGYRRGFGHDRGFSYGRNIDYDRNFEKGYGYGRDLGRRLFNRCLGWGRAFRRFFRGGFGFRRCGR